MEKGCILFQEKEDIFWETNNGKIDVTKLESPKTHCSGYMESNPNFQSLKLSMTLIY